MHSCFIIFGIDKLYSAVHMQTIISIYFYLFVQLQCYAKYYIFVTC